MITAIAEKSLHDRIVEATLLSLKQHDRYSEEILSGILDVLKRADKDVKANLLHYAGLGALPEGKSVNRAALKKLQSQIREITSNVESESSVILKTAVKGGCKTGITSGINNLITAKLPFYRDLIKEGIKQTGSRIFALVDSNTIDFLANYSVQLAGDVSRELADGINKAIMYGIVTGRSVTDVSKDIGGIVTDPETFRRTGKTVFKTAQYRMDMIVRTETLRAHNQGAIKFYNTVGVKKGEWMAVGDERMCPICGELDGKIYFLDKFPPMPAHPHCRCVCLPVISESSKLELPK